MGGSILTNDGKEESEWESGPEAGRVKEKGDLNLKFHALEANSSQKLGGSILTNPGEE
jgi:hypothetical protein